MFVCLVVFCFQNVKRERRIGKREEREWQKACKNKDCVIHLMLAF